METCAAGFGAPPSVRSHATAVAGPPEPPSTRRPRVVLWAASTTLTHSARPARPGGVSGAKAAAECHPAPGYDGWPSGTRAFTAGWRKREAVYLADRVLLQACSCRRNHNWRHGPTRHHGARRARAGCSLAGGAGGGGAGTGLAGRDRSLPHAGKRNPIEAIRAHSRGDSAMGAQLQAAGLRAAAAALEHRAAGERGRSAPTPIPLRLPITSTFGGAIMPPARPRMTSRHQPGGARSRRAFATRYDRRRHGTFGGWGRSANPSRCMRGFEGRRRWSRPAWTPSLSDPDLNQELAIAVAMARKAGARAVIGRWPTAVAALDGAEARTMMGRWEEAAAFSRAGVDILALNCGTGIDMGWAAHRGQYRATTHCGDETAARAAGLVAMKVVYRQGPGIRRPRGRLAGRGRHRLAPAARCPPTSPAAAASSARRRAVASVRISQKHRAGAAPPGRMAPASSITPTRTEGDQRQAPRTAARSDASASKITLAVRTARAGADAPPERPGSSAPRAARRPRAAPGPVSWWKTA
jgi:hypothetical protein